MTPASIRAAREAAGHTQTEAGELVGGTRRTWQDWEAGLRTMPPSVWELYRLRTDQHPAWRLVTRDAH